MSVITAWRYRRGGEWEPLYIPVADDSDEDQWLRDLGVDPLHEFAIGLDDMGARVYVYWARLVDKDGKRPHGPYVVEFATPCSWEWIICDALPDLFAALNELVPIVNAVQETSHQIDLTTEA